jgi:hypothetical protein
MLEAWQASQSTGATQAVTATTAPSAGLQLGPNIGLRIRTDAPVFFTLSKTSDVQCALPSSGAPTQAQGLIGPAVETFNAIPNGWISFATTSGSAGVTFTNGFGI